MSSKATFIPPELAQAYSSKAEIPKSQTQVEEDSFSPDIEVTKLPSGFLPYPEGSRITFRSYLLGELWKLSQIPSGSTLIRYEILMDGITTLGFDRWDLTMSDFLYIALLRKISSFDSPRAKIPFRCRFCGTTSEHTLELGSIDFEDLPDRVPVLPISVSLSTGSELKFMPLTAGSFLDLIRKDRADKSNMFAAQVVSETFEDAYNITYNVQNPKDSAILLEVDRLLDHGLAPLEARCPASKCGKINRLRLEAFEELVRPFCRERDDIKPHIRFGP